MIEQLTTVLTDAPAEVAAEWSEALVRAGAAADRSLERLRGECLEVLALIAEHAATLGRGAAAPQLAGDLDALARRHAGMGFDPSQTMQYWQALRTPLARRVAMEGDDPIDTALAVAQLLDSLALHTLTTNVALLERQIARQHEELIELSTPVISLWDGILALPLIGTVDSRRADSVMSNLLARLGETGSTLAIIDITGVSTVDTQVAQHLMRTIAAARLMGATCILSGIRPAIAQTIIQLGVNLSDIVTKATLQTAFEHALELLGTRHGALGPAANGGE